MLGYITRRITQYFIIFLVILVIIFILPRMLPGDPMMYYIGSSEVGEVGEATMLLKNYLIKRFGLNKSISEQFFLFVINTFQGYLGISWRYFPTDVFSLIIEKLPRTLFIVFASSLISFTFGFLLGVIIAWHRGSKLDMLIQMTGLISMSLPGFWVGMILLFIFAFYFPVFPMGGSVTHGVIFKSWWDFILDSLYHGALPIATLTIVTFFRDTLIMRNTILEILGEDFILIAQAKGLNDRTVMFKHAARNALLPLVTNLFTGLGLMVTTTIFVETVFSYPGIGLLLTEAIYSRDFPLANGILIVITVIFLLSSLLSDLVCVYLDPRIKLTKR